VIALPLVLMLMGLTGLKTAFLLPVQSRANWVFRVTDSPTIRVRHLAALDHACLRLVIFPVLVFATPLQIWAIGPDAWRSLLLAGLSGLAMAELTLLRWRRVPFTCSWIPGKRPLVLTLVGAIGIYLFVNTFLAGLLRLSLFSWPLLLTLSGVLLIVTATARRYRQESWAQQPLQFEDEPFRLQTLGLR
jgi:hypothetical protein